MRTTAFATPRSRRLSSALVALTLTFGGVALATAPAAEAADPGEVVAKLPFSSYSALAVDSAHQRVFVAGYDYRGTVFVYNFQGQQVGSLNPTTPASGLALSDDGTRLYVGQREHILTYDSLTLAQLGQSYAYNDNCGRELAVSGGKQWYTTANVYYSSECESAQSDLDRVSGAGAARSGWNAPGKLRMATGPGAENRLFMGQQRNSKAPDPFVTSFDTSGDNPVRGASRRFADAEGNGALDLKDLAVNADGTRVAVADAAYGTRLLNADDLSDAPAAYQPLPTGATSTAVAFSGDGKYVARGASAAGSTPDLLIQPADPANGTTPLEFAYEGELDGSRVVPRGLQWSQDGSRLFAVTTNTTGNAFWLHIVQPPVAQYDSRFTGTLSTTPQQAVLGEPVGIRGRLELDGPAPAEPVKVTATRQDADGTRKLAAVEVAADGSFTVLDVPSALGDSVYTVSFLGDLTHRPAEDVRITVPVAKAPSTLSLTVPAESSKSAGVELTGKLTAQGRPLPAGITLGVTRTDRLGTGTLTSVAVAADGTFRINDLPRVRGEASYTVTYAGDDAHEAATATATTLVRS